MSNNSDNFVEIEEHYLDEDSFEQEENNEIEYINEDGNIISQNVIYIASDKLSKKELWSTEAIRLLLQSFKIKRELLYQGAIETNKIMWEQVAQDLANSGFQYSAFQVQNKWKTMKRRFRHKGENKKPFIFEKEVAELIATEDATILGDGKRKYSYSDDEDNSASLTLHSQQKRSLKDEMIALKKEINNQNTSMVEMQKKTLDNQSKLLKCVERFQEKADTLITFQNKQLKATNGLLEQTKIQNSLLQRLLERL